MVFSPSTLPDFKHFQMKDFPKSVMIFLLSNSQWITLHILVQYPFQHKPTSFTHNNVSNFSGHWPTAEWRITTLFWMLVLNLTPTSFIWTSLIFVLSVPGNSQSLSSVCNLWFCAFLPYFCSSTRSYGCSCSKSHHFSLGRSQSVYVISFSEPFAALLSFWR